MDNRNMTLKLASVNARGCNNIKKKAALLQWMKLNKYDILNIQETHIKAEKIESFNQSFDGNCIHDESDTNHGKGVATIFKNNLEIDLKNNNKKGNGRLLLINFSKSDKEFTLVNLYAPTEYKYKKQFYEDTIAFIRRNKTQISSLIIVGDFNINAETKNKQEIEYIKNFKNQLNLVDQYIPKDRNDKGYTFYNSRYKSRIDYILIQNDLRPIMSKVKIKVAPVPDHRALEITLKVPIPERGPSYWKLNTQILREEEYEKNILSIFESTLNKYENTLDKGTIWDLFKIKVKEFSIFYSKNRKQIQDNEIKNLETKITELDNKPNTHEETAKLKEELEHKLAEISTGAQIRSRAEYVENGEKNTKFFLNLEKKRQEQNVITELKNENGKTLNKREAILQEIENFYKNLYSSKIISDTKYDEFLNNDLDEKKLTNDQKQLCEGKIKIHEAECALKNMKEKKSPGIDGIPAEFYKTFWNLIGEFLISVYNEAYARGELPYSMNRSIISLLFKKGEKNNIKNYRPISLTNIDYKILTHIITNRIHIVLSKLINTEQTAYVKKKVYR